MSLDLYLISAMPIKRKIGSGVFVREDGRTKELTFDEARKRYPDIIFSNTEEEITHTLYHDNITHNLTEMAEACGLYNVLWHSEGKHAKDIINRLQVGLKYLIDNKDEMLKYNPKNNWGSYDNLLQVATDFLAACEKYPNVRIDCSR